MKKKADTSEAVLDEHEIPSQKGNSKKSSSIYLDKAISSEEKLKIDKMFEAKEHAMLPTKSVKKIKTELKNKEQKQNTVCDETSKSTYHAVQYLTLWKNNRSKWKFKKTRQVWLLQNMYCKEKVLYGSEFFILKFVSCEKTLKIIHFTFHVNSHVCDILMIIPKNIMVRLKYLFTRDY